MFLLPRRWYKDDLCALAFKVVHDKQRGPLVFLRIYSGCLKPQTAVHNINRNSVYAVSITPSHLCLSWHAQLILTQNAMHFLQWCVGRG